MDLDKIQQLLRLVAESEVAEVSVEEDDFKITIRKKAAEVTMQPSSFVPAPYPMPYQGGGYSPQAAPGHAPSQSMQSTVQQPTGEAAGSGGQPSQTEEASGTESEADEAHAVEADEEVVRAPLVGTFFRRPAPDEGPFVEVGDTVEVGQVLCIIEAMKIMNEIESDAAGRVKEILVDDGESVEYDQPLFLIEPS